MAGIERWFLRAGLFLLPLAYWPGTYDRYVLPKLLVARVLLIGLLILYVLRAVQSGTVVIKRTPLDLPLLAFIGSALVSTVFAYNQNVAVFGTYGRYDGLLTILTYAGLFWVSVQALTGPGDARGLLRVLLASGYVVAALAILQSVNDSLAQGTAAEAFGTLGQKNVLGAFLAMLCPLAYRELVDARSRSARILSINLLAVIGLALLLTLSRSAWVGTALAAAVLVAGSRRPAVRIYIAGAFIVVVGGLALAGLGPGGGLQLARSVDQRAMTVFDPSAWSPRPAVWRDSLKVIASRPIVGYGPDNFGLVFPPFQAGYLGPQPVDKAHSESLQVAATQGLIGLLAYIAVLGAFVRAFWRGRRQEGAVAIFASWIAYQVTLQLNFSTLAAALPFWIFAAAAIESWGSSRRSLSWTFPRRRLVTAAGAAVVGTLFAVAVVGTAFPYIADARLLAAVEADYGGRWQQARTAAVEANRLAPEESVYSVEVGNIAFERSDWVGARDAYGNAARLGSYNPLVYRNLALADRNLGLMSEGRIAAREAVALDRFDPANRALLAEFETKT